MATGANTRTTGCSGRSAAVGGSQCPVRFDAPRGTSGAICEFYSSIFGATAEAGAGRCVVLLPAGRAGGGNDEEEDDGEGAEDGRRFRPFFGPRGALSSLWPALTREISTKDGTKSS